MNHLHAVIRQDSQGVPIHVGQTVAFNRSGYIARGEVADVQVRHIKIIAECEGIFKNWPQMAKVKNPRSIMVLENPKPDDPFLLKLP